MTTQAESTPLANRESEGKEFWITPPGVYAALDQEFHFDFDPCPYPHKEGYDGTEVEWGQSSYVNPPFRARDSKFGKGPTAFVRKAIEEHKKGKTVVVMLNTNAFINMLIEAGAELRSMGRLKWLSGKDGKPWPSPSNTTCFILRGGEAPDENRASVIVATPESKEAPNEPAARKEKE